MATKKSTENTRTYAEINAELNEIIAWFESDDIDLDEALVKYEQGVALAAELEKYLAETENKIEKIAKRFE